MRIEDKKAILDLKANGTKTSEIAKLLCINENTVKTILRRSKEDKTEVADNHCLCCGKELKQTEGRKHKKFCSDICRNNWWNSNRDKVNKKSAIKKQCKVCGKEFYTYGNQIYCSRDCYIKGRYGNG